MFLAALELKVQWGRHLPRYSFTVQCNKYQNRVTYNGQLEPKEVPLTGEGEVGGKHREVMGCLNCEEYVGSC